MNTLQVRWKLIQALMQLRFRTSGILLAGILVATGCSRPEPSPPSGTPDRSPAQPADTPSEPVVEYPPDPPLNFHGTLGERPADMPAPEPWPDVRAFRGGEVEGPPSLWIEGYAYPKQLCTWLRVTRRADGSLRTRKLYYYRVGEFADGSAGFELDLRNGGYLALKIDESVEPPEHQSDENGVRADLARPSTWAPNVKAAWFGTRGKQPVPITVSAPGGPGALPDDIKLIAHEMTNAVVTGPDAVVCEPRLDWSQLITIVDLYAEDPLEALPSPSSPRLTGGCAATTVLEDGRLLIAGGWSEGRAVRSAEIFDPGTGKFSTTGDCRSDHGAHTMSLCGDGRVLLVPGYGSGGDNPRPELWDPLTGKWELAPAAPRKYYVPASIELADGRILVLNGSYDVGKRTAELFDPKTGTWAQTGEAPDADCTTSLTRLKDGRVLMVGRGGPLGFNQIGTSVAALYDPAKDRWSSVAAPADVRSGHTATLLSDGRVLVAGGAFFKPSAEIFDPIANTWTVTEAMATDRSSHAATRLLDGRVLVIGGSFPMPTPPGLPVGEVFDPKTGHWTAAAKDAEIGQSPMAFTLADGRILVLSGDGRASLFRVRK